MGEDNSATIGGKVAIITEAEVGQAANIAPIGVHSVTFIATRAVGG